MNENGTNHQRKPMPKPVQWTGHESLKSEHATHLVIQSHGSEFMLLFFIGLLSLLIGRLKKQHST
jgi:hypothetical protein